jgi:hypothetical protein
MLKYAKPEKISLRLHPELNEAWVQERIAADPSLLGLGDLVLLRKERRQFRAGRLDLLFEDQDEENRYEVEIQLGATDESHIIRTLEYWDWERKQHPSYKHTAVLIAEDITSRFLNVVSLFNGTMPILAIQMQALTLRDEVMLTFTTVVDPYLRGLPEEDEDSGEAGPVDRAYWEARGSRQSLELADELLGIAKTIDPSLELHLTRLYIGLSRAGQPFNFVVFKPKKKHVRLELRLAKSDDIDARLKEADIEALTYNVRRRLYKLPLTAQDIRENRPLLTELMRLAYQDRIPDQA